MSVIFVRALHFINMTSKSAVDLSLCAMCNNGVTPKGSFWIE